MKNVKLLFIVWHGIRAGLQGFRTAKFSTKNSELLSLYQNIFRIILVQIDQLYNKNYQHINTKYIHYKNSFSHESNKIFILYHISRYFFAIYFIKFYFERKLYATYFENEGVLY
jgi:hypothetical protein